MSSKLARLQLSNPKLLRNARTFLRGQWVPASSGQTFPVLDPASNNQDEIAQVPDTTRQDALDAIALAHEAFPRYAQSTTAHDRSRLLRRWFDLIHAHREDLANILTAENGKPYREALGEVKYGAAFVEWFSEEAKRMYGELIPAPVHGRRLLVSREPVGVCTMITPWNFPVAMITRKMAPALAAGCSVVLKPSAETPLSALALVYLAEQAGFPAGTIQVLTCSKANTPALGTLLTTDERIAKLSVTGSTGVGKLLAAQSASTLKRLSLELGGNAPFLVFPPSHGDAQAFLERAVKGLLQAKLRGSGQTCVSPNRVFVHEDVHNEFVGLLREELERLRVGNGYDPETDLGPLISAEAKAKVERHLADAFDKGADLVTGGTANDLFFQPTAITGCTPEMLCYQEETFGPLIPIVSFDDDTDVVALANDTKAGLAAYVYTQDLSTAWQVAEKLQFGMVSINEGLMSTEVAPFGGIKESGYGREGSRHGLEEYTHLKYICMGGI